MALVQLTDAGVAAMQNATGPITLTQFKLGSSFGYVPQSSQSNIQGSMVYSGNPSSPVIEDANNIKYSVVLGDTAGPFAFGEIGLYLGSTLFAVCVLEEPMQKLPLNTSTETGGSLIIDLYLPMVGNNYEMWANVSQANTYKVSVAQGPEALPTSRGATPNIFVIQGFSSADKAFLAYTDRMGLWNFDGYPMKGQGTVITSTTTSVTISAAQGSGYTVGSITDFIVQFTSGNSYGACRYVTAIAPSAGRVVLSFNAALTAAPGEGDTFQILAKINTMLIPATPSQIGLVMPGTTLSVDANGVINVNQSTVLTDVAGTILGALIPAL